MRSMRASAGGSRGVVVPSPASEVGGSAGGTGGRSGGSAMLEGQGKLFLGVSWQSFFLQLDGAA